MKKIILYSYLKCSTCRKASNWLDQNNLHYQLVDIVKNPPSIKHLEIAFEQFIQNKKSLFNTRGKNFKLINFDIHSLSKKEIIKLLQSDGKLIKRPFLVYEDNKIILGFKEFEYMNQFK